MNKTKEIFYKKYCGEDISDIEEDVYCCVNEEDIPQDEHGFMKGTFEVSIKWNPEE